MTTDNVVDQAAAAANTPADSAPDVREARRVEISKDSAFWGGADAAKTKALRDEMRKITAPEAVAAEDKKQADAQAKLSPAEQRIAKANKNPALWDSKHKDHDAARKELREAIAAGATKDEQQAMADAPLEEHREVFGLTVPDERVLPKAYREDYNENYSGHEGDFLLAARQHGLDGATVRDLRDVGIRMAIEAEGKPVSEDAWSAMQKKFEGRLTKTQFTALKAWWKKSVEGGEAA